jgi:FG-GAP-like repeat
MTNTIPAAEDVSGSSYEDTFVSITLTSGGTDDASSEPPSFTFLAQPAHGTLWIAPPIPGVDPGLPATAGTPITADFFDDYSGVWVTSLTFVPDANWAGTTSFAYTTTDSGGAVSDPATASIEVDAVADALVIHPNVDDQPDALALAQKVTATSTAEDSPTLVALDGGGFVAVWQQGLTPAQVFARYYDDSGAPVGSAFAVSPSGNPFEIIPVATAMQGGGFAVAWMDLNFNTFETGISARVYAAGATTSTTITVAATANVAEANPAITAVGTGFVVTWEVESGSTSTILAQKYTASGVADGGHITITTAAAHGSGSGTSFSPPPQVATALADGSFVVSWSQADGTHAKIIHADGSASADITLAGGADAIAPYRNGFIATWADTDLHARIYGADGQAAGPALTLTNDGSGAEQTPVVAALPDGRFVVAWRGLNGTDGSADIFAEVFSADGTPNNGGPIQITTTGHTSNGFNQIYEAQPTITVLDDGRFAVGWIQPFATGGQNADVFLRVYDPGLGAVSGPQNLPLDLPTTFALTDTDGSEILQRVRIEGLPAGFSISDGTHVIGGREGGEADGAWIIDASERQDAASLLANLAVQDAHLTVIPAHDFVGDLHLAITATSREIQPPIAAGNEEATSASVSVPVTFTVIPNAAPAGTDGAVTLNGVDAYTFSSADFGFGDPDGNAFKAVKITDLPGKGTLYYDADGGDPGNAVSVSPNQSISAADIDAGKLFYRPAAGESGAAYAKFSFEVQDDGGTAGGGHDTDQSANKLTINVNGAPHLTFSPISPAPSLTENFATSQTELGLINLFDDGVGTSNLVLSGADKDLFSFVDFGRSTFTLYFNAGVTPDYETRSSYSVTVSVDDPAIGNGPEDSFVITVGVGNVDDPTVAQSSTVTIGEDTIFVLTSDQFHLYDQDSTPPPLQAISLINLPGNGKLYYDPDGGDPSNAVALTSPTQFDRWGRFFKSDLDAGKLWFAPDANESGPNYASFGFAIQINGGLTNTTGFNFIVTPVNDASRWSTGGSGDDYAENATVILADKIAVSDVELDALNGGLGDYSGASLTLQRSAGATGEDSFGFDTSGAGFIVAGNALQDLGGHTFATFSAAGGVLTIAFGNGGAIPTTALIDEVLQHVTYTNARDDLPNAPAEFAWTLDDGNSGAQGEGGALSATATTLLDFRSVDDAPQNTVPGAQTTDADTPLVFSQGGGNGIAVSDVDAGTQDLRIHVSAAHGSLTLATTAGLSISGNGTHEVQLTGSLAELNAALDGLTYRADAGYAGDDSLAIDTNDLGHSGGGSLHEQDAVAISIVSDNHPPALTVAASAAFTEGGAAVTLDPALTIADADGGAGYSATVRISGGFVAGDTLSGIGSYDEATHTFTTSTLAPNATLALLQFVLRSITFSSSSDDPTDTPRTLTWTISDGSVVDPSAVATTTVSVTPVDDAPVNTVPGPQAIDANTSAAIAGLAVSDVDAGSGSLTTVLSVAHGTLTVAAVGGAAVGGSGTGTVTISGTVAQIDATLGAAHNVVYAGQHDFSGTDTLTIETNDNGNSGAGGALTDTDQVAIIVSPPDETPVVHNDPPGGHSDLLWQNQDGTAALWTMNGLTVTAGANVGFNPGPSWHAIGSGDFNGDGKADILWQNADGTPAAWLMDGLNVLSGANVGFNPGAAWHVIAAADFNGDGKSDILWQNVDGTPAVWLMDGLNVLSGANVGFNPGAAWHAVGAGDFDGDGKADILCQNNNGQAAVWLMNGLSLKAGANVGFNPGAAWQVQAAGDFNGDGKADILWQNKDGSPAVWLMNGFNILSGANVGFNPGPNWQVHGSGDFNGDGKADIAWQNTNGTPAVWLMDGLSVVAGSDVGFNPGSSWHAIPPHHDLFV